MPAAAHRRESVAPIRFVDERHRPRFDVKRVGVTRSHLVEISQIGALLHRCALDGQGISMDGGGMTVGICRIEHRSQSASAMTTSGWAGCSADFSSKSIMTLTSSPVTVNRVPPGCSLGCNCWLVMTPSNRTRGRALKVTTMMTRLNGATTASPTRDNREYRSGHARRETPSGNRNDPGRCGALRRVPASSRNDGAGNGAVGPISSEKRFRKGSWLRYRNA